MSENSNPNPNANCRFCETHFNVKFGKFEKQGRISTENLFKPSNRKDCAGTILAEILQSVGIEVQRSSVLSERVCNPCARKTGNLGNLYAFIKDSLSDEKKTPEKRQQTKRVLDTPQGASPCRKTARVKSPARSKRSLSFNNVDSHLNIDEFEQTEELQVKVVYVTKSGNILTRVPQGRETKQLLRQICDKKWQAAANTVLKHEELFPEVVNAAKKTISKEVSEYVKEESILLLKNPDELAGFSSTVFLKEVRVFCPLLYELILDRVEDINEVGSTTNCLALVAAIICRLKNPKATALHYRISTVLFHSGAKHEDLVRLNRLGVCMHPNSFVRAQRQMCGMLEGKLAVWKSEIEENKAAIELCKQIREKQVPHKNHDDMDIIYEINMDEDYVKANSAYKVLMDTMDAFKDEKVTSECLDEAERRLNTTQLPMYKLVADNVDHEICVRVQTQKHKNRSIHWTHQAAVRDRVQDSSLDNEKCQKPLEDLQFQELLPNADVQDHLLTCWAVHVSRIVTKYLKPFKYLSQEVIRHISHPYTKEMSERSKICCLGMEFLNPNVSGDMAQILQNYQNNYVPISKSDEGLETRVLDSVPVHGDQLFEERARNVKWTFRDGFDSWERLDGVDTEFADWHAKYTLYKAEYKMFVEHASAGEIGTSMASINRTGKSNAAKGVENHYNEYSEFNKCEVEAHVLASFMEMTGMKQEDEAPNVILPDSSVSRETKARWLLDICKEHVKKYVFDTVEISTVVTQTDVLQNAQEPDGKWMCRAEGCEQKYAFHSGRVRHESTAHNLSLYMYNGSDEMDPFGYFYCRAGCSLVFKTKQTRNVHEEKIHDQLIPEAQPTNKPDPTEDYVYNYHSAKLTFGLVLMEFKDAIKEGDGERLFDFYKLALLLYHAHGHFKYAYVVLLHLVKCICILPARQALSCKWNRFYNGSGRRGENIPLDLKKEQQNKVLKSMWRALGPNLDESNAERVAGTLEAVEMIYQSIDEDCCLDEYSASRRTSQKDQEAVQQILQDLLKQEVFIRRAGREGYPSFPIFKRNIMHGLDYRELHKWIKEHVELWRSIY